MICKIYLLKTAMTVYHILQLRLLSRIHHTPSSPHLPPINSQHTPITMTPCSARQKHHRPRNILRLPQPPTRIPLRQGLLPTRHLHQPVRHPTREEPWRNSIHEDASRPELDGEVLGQVDHSCFGRRVAECCVGA
jgi:hypothetical protein